MDMIKENKKTIMWALIIWVAGFVSNNYFYPRWGFFRDWIFHVYSIGDVLFITSFALLLSIIWNYTLG
jgi:hypothetical protein